MRSSAPSRSPRLATVRSIRRSPTLGVGPCLVARGVSFVLVAASLVGCPRMRPPPIIEEDGGEVLLDVPFVEPGIDTDSDGLCDSTEATLGLAVGDSDTDDDGFSDAIEYAIGYDARRMDSPDRANVVYLREAPGARIDAALTFTAFGEGETLHGLFSDVRGVTTDPELSAFDYFADAQAIGALPPDAIMGVEGERFLGLRARATLTVRIGFENASLAAGCVRGFAFQYVLRDETSTRIAGSHRGLLVVTPDGVTPAGDTWCPIQPGCY
jgi:hypothetical protein